MWKYRYVYITVNFTCRDERIAFWFWTRSIVFFVTKSFGNRIISQTTRARSCVCMYYIIIQYIHLTFIIIIQLSLACVQKFSTKNIKRLFTTRNPPMCPPHGERRSKRQVISPDYRSGTLLLQSAFVRVTFERDYGGVIVISTNSFVKSLKT